ncbi:Neurotransmitter-gated ion-channel ligand-binding domain [Trinorchestia longiramus]|nr:Neurotransmitter-gated ion-channel ligand-binding domain [Trinorchestia longiramus]
MRELRINQSVVVAKGETLQQRLRQHLLSTYDAGSLPPNDVTNITMKFTVRNFKGTDDEPFIELNIWVMMTWTDPRLTWSALSAAHVPRLTFAPGLIWQPDVTNTNSEDPSDDVALPSTRLVVHPDGEVKQLCPAVLKVACTSDTRIWPHDLQTCAASFGSWVHDSDALDLIVAEEPVTMDMIHNEVGEGERNSHLAWTAIDSDVRRSTHAAGNSSVFYPRVILTLKLKRQPDWAVDAIRMAFVALSIVTSAVFLMPPGALEKPLLGVLFLLLHLQILAFTTLHIPRSPSHSPILVDLMCGEIMLTAIVLIVGVLVARLARSPDVRIVPAVVRMIALPIATCCRATDRHPAKATPSNRQQLEEMYQFHELEGLEASSPGAPDSTSPTLRASRQASMTSNEMVAVAIDRCCLVVYHVVVVTAMVVHREVIFF